MGPTRSAERQNLGKQLNTWYAVVDSSFIVALVGVNLEKQGVKF